jgi:DNA polymerase-3 subunit beta
MVANNPEQEEAEEEVSVNYSGEELEIGFNVSYLLDVLSVITGAEVRVTLSNSNSSALVEDAADGSAVYVVMPMRL